MLSKKEKQKRTALCLATMDDLQLFESGDKSGVSVVVRIRPPNNRETNLANNALMDHSKRMCVRVEPLSNETMLCVDTNPPKLFTFDHVAGPLCTQKDIYERCARSIVEGCLDGYNGTIFCYGQTGAGKTYTMIGLENHYQDESRGLIPRILENLFASIEQRRSKSNFEASLNVSFLEIYNEKITDLLLEPEPTPFIFTQQPVQKSLQLREDVKQGVYVEDLSHQTILSAKNGMDCLRLGLANRHVSATKMNEQSSRSHSVFTITIQSKLHESNGVVRVKTSHLHLIDLAGSERQQNTQTEGERLTEACSINKSLSALGNVIMSLVEKAKGRTRHVHYRDSKLTFLLKDSLGGNSRTCIVANISGSVFHLAETLGTLKFAQRAKFIKNRPVVNESNEGNVAVLQQQIADLRRIIADMQDHQIMGNTITSKSSQLFTSEFQRATLTESEKEEYENRMTLMIGRMEQSEKLQDYLQNQVEQYAKIAKGKEMLLHATRLALKLKECALAKLENREPNIGQSLLKLDYLHDFDMDDQSDSDMEFDELIINGEQSAEKRSQSDIQRLNKLLRKVWHPDRHPTVISLAMESYELRERLVKLESGEITNESATQKNDLYTKELQRQIHELVKAKHEKRHEIEEDSAQKHKYDEELSVDTNTKLLKLEQENNELRELLIKLQKEQREIQILEQENAELRQLVEQLRKSQEEVLSVTEVEQMLNEIEGLKVEKDELQVQYNSTVNKLDNLLHEIESFKSQLKSLENENVQLKEDRDILQSKLINQEDKLNIEIEGLKQENTSLALQINRWKQQYEQEASNSITLTRSIEQLNIQLSEQKKEMRGIREKEEDWRQSVLLKEHEINILTQQLAEATITLEDFRYKFDVENKRCKRLEKNMLEGDSNQNQHELVQQYEQEILNLRSKIEEKSLQINQLHSTHQAELNSYEIIKQNAEKEIERLQVKLQRLEESSSETEAALQSEERLQQTESERDSLKASLLKSERHIEMLELEMKKIQHALKEQQELGKIAQDQKQTMNTELQEKVQQLKHQETELRSQLHKLQVENNSLKDVSEKLKIELTSKQNDTIEGEKESQIIEEINKFREEKQGQIDFLSERCHSLEVQLASQEDELYAKKHEIELERNSLLKTVQEQSAQLEGLNMEVTELRNLNNKLERQNGELMGHRNPKQKIQQIVKIKQENNDLRAKVRQLEIEIDQFNKNQQNKENEYYADSLSLYNNSNASKLNLNRGSCIDTPASQPLSLLGNTSNIESREVEALKKQLSTVENTVSNLVRMYSAKKRKFDSNLSPNASKATSFKRVMSMLTDLENACSNNRGARGSNTR